MKFYWSWNIFRQKTWNTFFKKILLDTVEGLQFLHNCGTAYGDLKLSNILVSNCHYSYISDNAALNKAIKTDPLQYKLTNFGESRSTLHQTRTVQATRTKHEQRVNISRQIFLYFMAVLIEFEWNIFKAAPFKI